MPHNAKSNYHYLGESFYYDTEKENLYYKNSLIQLGTKEKHLLSILIDANYSTVKTNDLEYLIWGNDRASQSALRTLVYRLREKLKNSIIQVTYNDGYSLKKPKK